MIRTFAAALSAALLFCSAEVSAQGVLFSAISANPPAPLTGLVCDYDCSDPGNTVIARVNAGSQLNFVLGGDDGGAAVLLIALGPPLDCAGAIPVPGFGNALHLDPVALLPVAPGVAAMSSSANGRCNARSLETVVSNLTLTATFVGIPLTFQGIVVAGGGLTFSRPIEVLVQ